MKPEESTHQRKKEWKIRKKKNEKILHFPRILTTPTELEFRTESIISHNT